MKNIETDKNPKAETEPALEAEKAALKAANDALEERNVELESTIAALRANLAAVTAKVETDPVEDRSYQAAAQKKVKVKLPLTRTEKDDVFVGLNGKTYLIKRGVEAEVPEGVARILERKEKLLSIAMEYEAKAAAPLDELAQMYKQ